MSSERSKGIAIGVAVSVVFVIGSFGVIRVFSPATPTVAEEEFGSGDEYYTEPEDAVAGNNQPAAEPAPGTKPTGNFWEPDPSVTQEQIDKALAPSPEEQRRQQLIDENLRLQNEALKRQEIMDSRKAIKDKTDRDREIFRRGQQQ